MDITNRNIGQPKRDLGYWRDVIFGGLGAICIVASIGHFLDWLQQHQQLDWQIGLSFLAAFGFLLLLSPKRFEFILIALLVIVACGTLNAIASQTLIGLPIIAPCAVAAYLMVRHKYYPTAPK
jgi:hypothetical protein